MMGEIRGTWESVPFAAAAVRTHEATWTADLSVMEPAVVHDLE